MIGKHCGERLISVKETRHWFMKKCVVCRKRFIQHKRLSTALKRAEAQPRDSE